MTPNTNSQEDTQMKTGLLITTALLTLAAGTAMAQSVADHAVSQLRDQGYSNFEIYHGSGRVKVEAIRGNTEVEYIYDTRTGALLSRDIDYLDRDDDDDDDHDDDDWKDHWDDDRDDDRDDRDDDDEDDDD